MKWWLAVAVLWCVMAALGRWIAAQKGRDMSEGLLLGLCFGPMGALIEALLPNGIAEDAPHRLDSRDLDEPDDSVALAFLGEMEPPKPPPPPLPDWLEGVAKPPPESAP